MIRKASTPKQKNYFYFNFLSILHPHLHLHLPILSILSILFTVHFALSDPSEKDDLKSFITPDTTITDFLASDKGQEFLKGLGIKPKNLQEQQIELLRAFKEAPSLAEINFDSPKSLSSSMKNHKTENLPLKIEDPYDLQSIEKIVQEYVDQRLLTTTDAKAFMALAKQATTSQNTGQNLLKEILLESLRVTLGYPPLRTQEEFNEIEDIRMTFFEDIYTAQKAKTKLTALIYFALIAPFMGNRLFQDTSHILVERVQQNRLRDAKLEQVFSLLGSAVELEKRGEELAKYLLDGSLKINFRNAYNSENPHNKALERLSMEIFRIVDARSCDSLLSRISHKQREGSTNRNGFKAGE